MTAIYLVDVVGDGLTPQTAYRFPPSLINDQSWRQLMIDTVRPDGKKAVQMKGLIVHPSNSLATTGIRLLRSAATSVALVASLKSTAPSGAERNFLNGYTDANGYTRLPTTSWWAALLLLLAQTEPAIDLEATILSVG